jgi:PAS domain S-box-containing protein
LIVLILATFGFTKFKMGLWEKDVRADLFDVISGKKSNLEKALFSRIYYTRGVAAYVSINPDISDSDFAKLAKEYIRNDSVISSMALSKDCILNAIYPFEGHEAALGLNLLKHPERKAIVEKTIETHLTFVAGPVVLVEGGSAFISYTPIFDKSNAEDEPFWGVTDIVIKLNSLFDEAGLKSENNNYLFALRGVNGSGHEGAVFWGNKTVFEKDPVTVQIELPIGNWILAAIPNKGWKSYGDQDKTLFYILVVSAFIISVLIWLFARSLYQLRYREKEQKAIFASLDSLIIEFNSKGEYVKIAATNKDLLFLPDNELIGKKLSEVFDKPKTDYFMQAIKDCLKNKKLVVIEYPMEIRGEEFWFSARISYKSEHSIIFNAIDITEAKNREKRLKQSEQQLKDLNATKDKFFSIIAHDLRNPLGSQKGVIDLILEQYETLDESTRKELLSSLQASSNLLYELLESLLEWAMSQSGQINVDRKEIILGEHFATILSLFQENAKLKNIHFKNELNGDPIVWADVNLTETILRNLISNAIKFTHSGGVISIRSEKITKNNAAFLKVSISDNGMGMDEKSAASLFMPHKTLSSRGTADEKGNGLGLLLCKEFAEKQGGEISVISSKGEGSVFSFTLPLIPNAC